MTHSEIVCKVHETKFGLILKGGASQSATTTGEFYSTDKEMEDLLADSTSVKEFTERLESQLKHDTEAALLYIIGPMATLETLKDTTLDISTSGSGRMAILFEPTDEQRPGEGLEVGAEKDFLYTDNWGRHHFRYRALTVLEWRPISDLPPYVWTQNKGKISYPDSVRMFGNVVPYSRPDAWVQKHPQEALLEILRASHADRPDEVGPPYVILQVKTKSKKIHWLEKGVCPSWDEHVIEPSN
jgi:hypothetical protein